MNEQSNPPGLWPVPGDGVLARHGSLILLSSLDSGQFVDVLLDLLAEIASSGGDGRRFADAVADAVEKDAMASDAAGGDADQPGPAVLAFGAVGAGMAVTVSGGAWADITTVHGEQRIAAGQPGMLIRCVLRSPVTAVRGGLGLGADGKARIDRFSRLDGGTVRAGGLAYFPVGVPRLGAAAASPEPMPPQVAAVPVAAEAGMPAEPVPAEPMLAEPAFVPAELPPAVPAEPAPVEFVSEPEPAFVSEPEPAFVSEPEPASEPEVPADPMPVAEPWPPPAAEPALAAAAEHDLTVGPMSSPISNEPFEAVLLIPGGPGIGDLDEAPRQRLSSVIEVLQGASSIPQGPMIQGVYCKNGHFDDPEARFCAVCGISMNQLTLVPSLGPRPPLGVLVLDDGSVFQLDSDYIVGREPTLDATVASGEARPLRVADDAGIVSRVHARVQLDGWRVLIVDLGSANGTRIRLPSQQVDQPLLPRVPVLLHPGSQVDLGGRALRYESHRGR